MDQLRDLYHRVQDHALYRRWEDIPKQKKLLGLAIAGLGAAILILTIQLWGSRALLVELKPDEIAAAKQEARESDRKVLAGLDAKALKDELDRRKISVDEAKKANDPDRVKDAEEAWERVNEIMLGKKK